MMMTMTMGMMMTMTVTMRMMMTITMTMTMRMTLTMTMRMTLTMMMRDVCKPWKAPPIIPIHASHPIHTDRITGVDIILQGWISYCRGGYHTAGVFIWGYISYGPHYMILQGCTVLYTQECVWYGSGVTDTAGVYIILKGCIWYCSSV